LKLETGEAGSLRRFGSAKSPCAKIMENKAWDFGDKPKIPKQHLLCMGKVDVAGFLGFCFAYAKQKPRLATMVLAGFTKLRHARSCKEPLVNMWRFGRADSPRTVKLPICCMPANWVRQSCFA